MGQADAVIHDRKVVAELKPVPDNPDALRVFVVIHDRKVVAELKLVMSARPS